MLRVRTSWSSPWGGDKVSTLYFAGEDGTAAESAADAVRAMWDGMKARISSSFSAVVESPVYLIDPTDGKPIGVFATEQAPVVGTDGGEILPFTTQGLIQFHTGEFFNGRERRGRLFVPGPTEAQNSGGFPLSAYTAALDSAAGGLLAEDLVVYSVEHRAFSFVSDITVWNDWAELRTRRNV